MSAIIPLDELLILSCWMIVNCFLLKHGAKQGRLYRHFVGRQNVTWLTPSPPKRQNDVILEKIVWRCPLRYYCIIFSIQIILAVMIIDSAQLTDCLADEQILCKYTVVATVQQFIRGSLIDYESS